MVSSGNKVTKKFQAVMYHRIEKELKKNLTYPLPRIIQNEDGADRQAEALTP